MKKQTKSFHKERRQSISSSLPTKDRNGVVIARERRQINPDHQADGLECTRVDLSQQEFQQYFDKFENSDKSDKNKE